MSDVPGGSAEPSSPAPGAINIGTPPVPPESGKLPMDALFAAMASQAEAQSELLRRIGGHADSSGNPVAMLVGGAGGEDPSMPKLPGAKGAAVQELLRADFDAHPGKFALRVRQNLRRARQVGASDADPRIDSAREYLADEVPFGSARTLAFLGFGLATVFDQMRLGLWEQAEDSVARLLVATEQAALDNSSWQLAWLMTHFPEPPWSRLAANRPRPDSVRKFGQLADPAWVAAAIAYTKDVAALQEVRKRSANSKEDDTGARGGGQRRPGGAKGGGRGQNAPQGDA